MLATAAAHVDAERRFHAGAANGLRQGPTWPCWPRAGDEVSAARRPCSRIRVYQAVVKAAAFTASSLPTLEAANAYARRSGQCGLGTYAGHYHQRTDPDAVGPKSAEPQRIQCAGRAAGDRAAGCGRVRITALGLRAAPITRYLTPSSDRHQQGFHPDPLPGCCLARPFTPEHTGLLLAFRLRQIRRSTSPPKAWRR